MEVDVPMGIRLHSVILSISRNAQPIRRSGLDVPRLRILYIRPVQPQKIY